MGAPTGNPKDRVILTIAAAARIPQPGEEACFYVLCAIQEAAAAADEEALDLALGGICALQRVVASDGSGESRGRLEMLKALAWLASERLKKASPQF